MKKFLFTAVLTANILIFNACSASKEQTNAANTNANVGNQTIQNSQSNVTTAIPDAEKKSREVFNENKTPETVTIAKNPENGKNNDYQGRTAPDDSTFNTTMNEKGQFVETRTFRNHPQLAKVERVVVTPKEKKIFVYLKNGKVVEVADDKLENFQANSPGIILEAAGVPLIQPTPRPNDGVKKIEQKAAN